MTAIASASTDMTAAMQKLVLGTAQNKDINSTGNLPYQLTVKEGLLYDLTANVDVEDGMVNGAECQVRYIEKNPANKTFPKCICLTSLMCAKPKEKNEICRSISTRAVKCDGVFFVLQHSFQYGFQHA